MIFLMCFILYSFNTFKLLIMMFRRHNLAFRNHAPRLVPLTFLTLGAILYVGTQTFNVASFFFCVDVISKPFGSFCTHQANTFFARGRGTSNLLIFMRIVPMISFLLLNKPHDCYRCLGKDPDRIFSIHQLTERETMIREIRNKFGVQAYDDLIEGNGHTSIGTF